MSFWVYPEIFIKKIGYISEILRFEEFRGHLNGGTNVPHPKNISRKIFENDCYLDDLKINRNRHFC